MPHEIGYVQNTGVLAHYMMLDKIKTFAEANGYTILRYVTDIPKRELIMKAPGYSGDEEIFMGFRCYQDSVADYYNITVGMFTGYVSGNTFEGQPGARIMGIPTHNMRIDYWLTLTPQRIALAMKVGTPVYVSAYVGKILPYATPAQYPYPVAVGGMLDGEPATRFSDTNMSVPWPGSRGNFALRPVGGIWIPTGVNYPYSSNDNLVRLKDTDGVYPLLPMVIMDASNVYGEFEGIFWISGFNNVVENTMVVDGITYVVIQDVYRTASTSYYALRMDE